MRFNRLAPIAALALTVVTTVSAQIPSGARRLGAPAVAAPKLMVATPFAFAEGDSVMAGQFGNAMRSRLTGDSPRRRSPKRCRQASARA